MERSEEQAKLLAALDGERAAQTGMVKRLSPLLHKVAASLLWSLRPMMRGRPSRQEVVDLVHDGWDILLASDGKALRRWDPTTGPLEPYVSRVVRNRLVSKLRTLKHNPFTEDPIGAETIERLVGMGGTMSARVEDADLATKVLVEVWEKLTPLGRDVLQVFLMDGATVDEVMEKTGLSKESVRTWRKRIRKAAREVMDGILVSKETPS